MNMADLIFEWWGLHGTENQDGYDAWLDCKIGVDADDDYWAITLGFFCIQDEDVFE